MTHEELITHRELTEINIISAFTNLDPTFTDRIRISFLWDQGSEKFDRINLSPTRIEVWIGNADMNMIMQIRDKFDLLILVNFDLKNIWLTTRIK